MVVLPVPAEAETVALMFFLRTVELVFQEITKLLRELAREKKKHQ